MSRRNLIIGVVVLVLIGVASVIYFSATKKNKINYLSDFKSNSELGTYSKFVISSDATECAPLGRDILKRKGTAVDAAITVLLCMSLVLPHSLGLGGGSFMTFYDRNSKKGIIYDGREQAAQFVKDAKFDKMNLQNGPFSVAIPGELAVYFLAHKEYGKLKWAELFENPIKLARKGVKVNRHLASNIQKNKDRLSPELKKILSNKNGDLLKEGDILVREDLADTYQKIADSDNPIKLFYRGELTDIFVEELKESQITHDDFKNYEANRREAIVYDLDDENRLLVPTLPSSGVLLGFIMKVIAELKNTFIKPNIQYSLKDSAWFNHQLAEIFKHAYSRRAVVADEAYAPELTKELLKNFTFNGNETNSYFEDVLLKVKNSKETHEDSFYGGKEYFISDNGTAHLSIIDSYGNALSVTSTINIYFGSGIVSKTGIIFNDENDDYSITGITNYFGLPASKANVIEPGKRPASSMCPAIVVNRKTDDVKLSIGGAGGSLIISGMAQALTRILYMNENIKHAIDQYRFHHQLFPNQFQYENGFNKELLNELNRTYKHQIITIPNRRCILTAVSRDKDGKLYANADYRKGGSIDGE